MNSWIISVDNSAFDFEKAFFDNGFIKQHVQNNSHEIRDFVYLYCTKEQEIKYKCLITKINIPTCETVDEDEKYVLNREHFENKRKYKHSMELTFIEKMNVGIEKIQKCGVSILPFPQIITDKLLEYLDNISDIDIDEILPEKNSKTEIKQTTLARKGQGVFRTRVIDIDKECHVTGVKDERVLIASHILPWKDSNDFQRLDGNNGILLSPHLDKLFDKHLISFDDDGKIVVYSKNAEDILHQWGIDTGKKYFDFSKERKEYLKVHRDKCIEKNKAL